MPKGEYEDAQLCTYREIRAIKVEMDSQWVPPIKLLLGVVITLAILIAGFTLKQYLQIRSLTKVAVRPDTLN